MPTTAFYSGLNPKEFARARKDMFLNGTVSIEIWEKANSFQKGILHQLELTLKSLTPADIKKLKAQINKHK